MNGMQARNMATPPLAHVQAHAKTPVDLWSLVVWAYQRQKVDLVTGRGLNDLEAQFDGQEPHRSSVDGVVALQRIAEVGCRIEGGQHANLNNRVHPDAVTVHDAVLSLGWRAASLIVNHARQGERPEPSSVQPHPFPTVADRAKDRWRWAIIEGQRVDYQVLVSERVAEVEPIFELRGRKRVAVGQRATSVDVEYCPIDWYPDLTYVDMMSAVHASWRDAMDRLNEVLGQVTLRDYVVSGIEPEALAPLSQVVTHPSEGG